MSRVSDQTRAIIAAALSLIVIVAWSLIYKPPKPPAPAGTPNGVVATPDAVVAPPPDTQPAQSAAIARPGSEPRGPSTTAPAADVAEKITVIESDLYRVELSSRGAVVRSWQLKKYSDDHQPPRTLDVVNAEAARQSGDWPFSLQMGDTQLETAANKGLYVVSTPAGTAVGSGAGEANAATLHLAAPAEVDFHWSDGQLDVTKKLKFDDSYIARVEISVRRDGQPVPARIAWRGGFGDVTAYRAAIQTVAFSGRAGSITQLATKNLGSPTQHNIAAEVPGDFDTVGIEDLYFAAAFLPPETATGQPAPANLTLAARQMQHELQQPDGKTTQEILPEVAAGVSPSTDPVDMRVFVGPKDLDLLKAIHPPLNGLVQFGWTGFISEPLFYILLWLHRYVPNYGWAIVAMTVAINMLLYPLKVSSWRSMQKMQKVAPEIRTVQDRYKKYSVRDPRKQEMNKEVMAIYSREGINPLGSCLPMVAQFPIWFGLNRMLTATIELRHAPWFGWIHDLSSRDPYYILPITMAVLMYVVQKMTPVTVTDPAQARMMALTPIMFGGMFIVFPISSGLALYILTSSAIAILQQWHLNRISPLKAVSKGKKKIASPASAKSTLP
jgi:YidC/Oxa1 family membrane protein insertase